MLPRLTALLVIWFALLGAAAPALACALADSDCCPQDLPSPCGDDAADFNPAAAGSTPPAVCCVAAPVPSSAASLEPSCASRELLDRCGSTDPPLLLAREFFAVDLARSADPRVCAGKIFHTDAALIYLRTGRLRL